MKRSWIRWVALATLVLAVVPSAYGEEAVASEWELGEAERVGKAVAVSVQLRQLQAQLEQQEIEIAQLRDQIEDLQEHDLREWTSLGIVGPEGLFSTESDLIQVVLSGSAVQLFAGINSICVPFEGEEGDWFCDLFESYPSSSGDLVYLDTVMCFLTWQEAGVETLVDRAVEGEPRPLSGVGCYSPGKG